ncbi:MAG: TolC family protein [Candidatus Margulisiibacteriota bacterium]
MKHPLACLLVLCLLVGVSSAQEKLTLDRSIRIALDQSPVMHKIKAEIEAAEGAAGQAVADFLPQLTLKGSLGKYYSEPMTVQITFAGTPQAFEYGTDEQANTTSYSASLTQPIFKGGKLWKSLAMADKGLEAAKEELRKIAQEVKFNVISSYYGVLKTIKLVELSKQSVNMAKSHLDRVNSLFKVGMSTRADILRGEVQVAQAEIGLTKAKQGLEIAKNHFNNTLGIDLDAPVELLEIEYDDREIPVYDYKDLLKVAYEDRPDWKQYVLARKVSEDEIGLASSGLWPEISLVGNYDVGSTKYSTYQSDTKNWTALLSGTWDIFDGTATWYKIKESKAKLEAQKANEISVKRAIALEVKDANFAVQSSKENVEGAEKTQELAKENSDIAELRYDSGVGTNLEVIDAQVALTQARTDHLQAQHDLQIAKARINKIVGRKIY